MLNSYYTVKQPNENEIIVEKSRFIAHVKRVESEEDAQNFIETINKDHWKATHNCYAYVIGENNHIQKASDNGEPSGTAGVPMLEVLKKKDLRDTAVVVTRYFGGIKLGAGGLIRTYSRATSEGLHAAGIVERQLMNVMAVTMDYSLLGTVENELRNRNYKLKDTHYTHKVTIELYVDVDNTDEFSTWMTNLCSGNCQITQNGEEYLELNSNKFYD
ncbi:YigZ family protein [Tuberibacillus sp. Marseille-P3662]|uniref:YigZ family protein n=1 Tax=Tuberibacillus sp. Marseille-P3662 TaxID=1965358 RepID=UPI000A1CAA0D|nr:YigZ family protein [Tuberibacillus sp. Marseille-P3662]